MSRFAPRLVGAAPRRHFGSQALQLGLQVGIVLGELTHRRHVVLPLNRSALRASSASAISNGVADPDSNCGRRASSQADVPSSVHSALARLRFDDVHHALAQSRTAAGPQLSAALKILEMPVQRRRPARRSPAPRGRSCAARAASSATRPAVLPRALAAPDCSARDRRHDAPLDARRGGTRTHAEHQLDLGAQAVRTGPVGLVHREDVGDLHQTRLERLDRVARFGHEDHEARIRRARDIQLALADADGLDEDAIGAERIEHVAHLARGGGETAQRAARRERPDVHARIERDVLHADAVAEQRAAGERRRGIDADDADGEPLRAIVPREARRDRALSRARRAR